MTITAIRVGGYMVERFANRRVAVMTGSTIIDNPLMIKVGVRKRGRGMAHRAVLTGRNVRRIDLGVFACGIRTVMTGSAVGDDAIVVEHRRREGPAGYVADSTVFAGRNMIRNGIFAGCIDPIVAGVASAAEHFGSSVIDKRFGKAAGVVTDRAITGGVLMHRYICHCQRAEDNVSRITVVTGSTVPGDTDMIKRGRSKAAVDMADTKVLQGWQVIGGLEQFRTVREKLILVTAAALLGGWNVIADLRRGDTCRMTDCAVIRIYPDMAEDDARQAVETAFGGQGVCGHSCGFAVVASCRSAALASGFDENVQLKPSGSAELVTDLLPSRLAVSPTRRRIMGPVLATTLVKPSADGFSPDAGSVVGFWPKGDSEPPDPPQAEIPKTSENTNKLFVRN